MRLEAAVDVELERFETNPFLSPDADDRIGSNVDGPSVVRAPAWFDDPVPSRIGQRPARSVIPDRSG